MRFGTKVTVFKPKETRKGHKTPGQQKAYDAVMIGYIQGMRGYRVFDLEERKPKEASFNFCSFEEGRYPYKEKHFEEEEDCEQPVDFYPTFDAFVDPKEWGKFGFDLEEEGEVIRKEELLRYFDGDRIRPDSKKKKKENMKIW